MIVKPSPGGDHGLPDDGRSAGFAAVLLIIILTVLLMAFSLAAVLLDQAALAATAGTAAVGLAGETGRRALRHTRRPDPPPAFQAEADVARR